MLKFLSITISTLFITINLPSFAMSGTDLVRFAKNNRISMSKNPLVYNFYDRGCQRLIPVHLVKTMNLGGGKIGAITTWGACWGANYTYFEMTRGNLKSLRVITAVESGRSMHYSNWSPVKEPSDGISKNDPIYIENREALGRAISVYSMLPN